MNALAKKKVGDYVDTHFVSAFQKVATFQVAGNAKQGGNVAAYFCTPDREVLHAIAGPVDEDTFLREARWAVEAWNLSKLENHATPGMRKVFFRKAHEERLREKGRPGRPNFYGVPNLARLLDLHGGFDNQSKVHLLLTTVPLAKIEGIYRIVFEKILNEKISTNPVQVAGR